MKGINGAVIGNIPVLGQGWLGLGRDGVRAGWATMGGAGGRKRGRVSGVTQTPTTENAVQFSISAGEPLQRLVAKGGHRGGTACLRSGSWIGSSTAAACVLLRGGLLDERIPAAAAVAATEKLPGLRSAALADVKS